MDDIRSNSSQNMHSDARAGGGKPNHDNKFGHPTPASKTLVFLLIIVSIMIIVVMALSLFTRPPRLAKDDQYQAVFLTNGQVYFGKLTGGNANYLLLEDVYYLQQNNQEQVQQAEELNEEQANLQLVKLGEELHGPEDAMYISKEQILFWENLKDNGRVTEGIKQHKTQN